MVYAEENKNPIAIVVVQARTGSSRFPRKVLQDLAGKPLLAQMVARAKQAPGVVDVVIATSDLAQDDPIEELAAAVGLRCFRGSENDVLLRFLLAAQSVVREAFPSFLEKKRAVKVVRLTGDCPLVHADIIGRSLALLDPEADYVGYSSDFPDGMDTESFWLETLMAAEKEAKKGSEREHVTPYIWGNPEKFRLKYLKPEPGEPVLRNLRLSIDHPEDLENVRSLWNKASRKKENFGLAEIAEVLAANPELDQSLSKRTRNEGYIKSLREDAMKDLPRRTLTKSDEWWERAVKRIPNGTQTLSKSPTQFIRGVYPKFIERGQGAYLWDVDGNKYIDYPMSLGAILLGHAHPKVVSAVTKELERGNLFTLMSPLEVLASERLCEMIPTAEMVRFGKNGADATSGAIRCARSITKREHVAYCGYHGYQDWYAAVHPMSGGVPQFAKSLMHEFSYNNIESLKKVLGEHKGQIACVIMEQPVIEPKDNFLQQVEELARAEGALFIMDEIVTGFRYSKGGAQLKYNVRPDLSCFGKAMANGLPVSAVVGRKEVMKEFENVFFSTTFGGDTTALAATLAVTDCILHEGVIEHIWSLGEYWIKSFNEVKSAIGGVNVTLNGNAPRTVLEFRDASGALSVPIRSLFLQETCKRGILFGVPIFMTFSHTRQDIDKTVEACAESLKICKKAIEDDSIPAFMEGEMIGPIFRPQPKN